MMLAMLVAGELALLAWTVVVASSIVVWISTQGKTQKLVTSLIVVCGACFFASMCSMMVIAGEIIRNEILSVVANRAPPIVEVEACIHKVKIAAPIAGVTSIALVFVVRHMLSCLWETCKDAP